MSIERDAVNAAIGMLMGERPRTVWRCMNHDETAFCMEWKTDDGFTLSPEREAKEWFAEKQQQNPGYIERNGYHLVRVDVWPNFMGETCAGARFINWALKQPHFANQDVFSTLFVSAQISGSLQESLADMLVF